MRFGKTLREEAEARNQIVPKFLIVPRRIRTGEWVWLERVWYLPRTDSYAIDKSDLE